VACLVWDNIIRGSSISCPHIEAALTAAEISDRVLGVSTTEAVPSTTVHIFTGNAIYPRGDMASRSLMMELNVDRPDPENRSFEHADPLAWTQANRPRIVRALYTLLRAGPRCRPQGQEAKTRFKPWWQLVGSPVEYAAGLLGIDVDCTELMRLGEEDDEEAVAVSSALTIFHEIWGTGPFTSQDVAKAMTIEFDGWQKGAAEGARAEKISDALGELVGKRLDRPTAHSIGKLFQKRLVNRPAWIGDGQGVLRRHQGHAENTYRVEVKGSRGSGDEETIFAGERGPKHSQHSPHSPTPPPTAGDPGDVGKGGDVPGAAGGNGAISQFSLPLTRPGSGNVGKEGNGAARIGDVDVISPEATDAIVGHDEAPEPSPEDWELCHDPR
jgi:hypothetical protein